MIFRTRFKYFQIEVRLCFDFGLPTIPTLFTSKNVRNTLVQNVKAMTTSLLKSKLQEVLKSRKVEILKKSATYVIYEISFSMLDSWNMVVYSKSQNNKPHPCRIKKSKSSMYLGRPV